MPYGSKAITSPCADDDTETPPRRAGRLFLSCYFPISEVSRCSRHTRSSVRTCLGPTSSASRRRNIVAFSCKQPNSRC
ncbi:hypothetical protein BDW67DRAFT_171647 [Aspergillus spinulosporus]